MTSLDDLPLRDDLRGLSPYGAPQLQVPIALNVNENTHPIPDDVVAGVAEALAQAIRGVNRYPDREFTELRTALAGYVSDRAPAAAVTAEHVWAANGSNEILQQILQAFGGPGRRLLGFPPTYSMHSIIAAGTGTEWVTAERDDEWRIGPATAVAAIERAQPDLVFLCAPNNPTGTPLGLDTIAAAYDAFDGVLVVDEAYAEFAPADEASALSLLDGRPRLIVTRTMSKAFAFAGVRLGYLIADPAIADAMRLVRLPYHLSALTQAAAIAALGFAPTMLATVADIREQRDRMSAGLRELGFRPYESAANFVLFAGLDDPRATFEELLENGILVRDVGLPGTLRVTAGTEYETTVFLNTLARMSA